MVCGPDMWGSVKLGYGPKILDVAQHIFCAVVACQYFDCGEYYTPILRLVYPAVFAVIPRNGALSFDQVHRVADITLGGMNIVTTVTAGFQVKSFVNLKDADISRIDFTADDFPIIIKLPQAAFALSNINGHLRINARLVTNVSNHIYQSEI